jgi:hypothetical protein
MCFSATASFTAGAVLAPAGIYCVVTSLRKRPETFLLSLVPAAFGIQQLSEGVVWHALEHGDSNLAHQGALVFLFFALAFWPFWFSFISAMTDPRPRARQLFILLTIAASSWFWLLFFPLLTGHGSFMTIEIVNHSIFYDITKLPINQITNRAMMRSLYFACVVLPMIFGAERMGLVPGLVLGVMVIFSAAVYHYAFVSVWCFFAAWLSLYLCVFFWKMKPQKQGGIVVVE